MHFLLEGQEAAVGAELEFILLKIDVSSCRKRSLFSYCSPRLLWSFPRLRVSCLYLTCIYPLINEIVLFYFILFYYQKLFLDCWALWTFVWDNPKISLLMTSVIHLKASCFLKLFFKACSFQPLGFKVWRVSEVSFPFHLPLTGYCCSPFINEEWADVH